MRLRALSLGVRLLAFAAGVTLLAILPHWLGDFRASDVAYVGVYFIAIMGLNILTGFTGQISLGHGAFMAIGGYTTAILVVHYGVRDLWTIPIAGLVAGGAGLLFAVPALRLTGMYLAVATFALPIAFPQVVKKFDKFTGGSEGIQLVGDPNYTGKGYQNVHALGQTLTFNNWLYYLTWTIAVVLFVIAWILLGGRAGRTFRAIRDSEIAARSSGVNLPLYKTLAFGVSALYAGIAGSLFVIINFSVSPGTFPIDLSLLLLIGAVISGLGSLWGIAVGAIFLQYLPSLSEQVSKSQGAASVAYGLAVIVAVLLLPYGAAGLVRRVAEPLTNLLSRRS
jgi:branched-chain amino acid transport system permease protein